MHSTQPALLRLVESIDADSIDAAVVAIDDEIVKIEVACLLAQLGSTEMRCTIVGDGFARFLTFPAVLNRLVAAAELLWSDAMLQRIIDAIVRVWRDGGWVYESALSKLSRFMTRTQAQSIIAPALSRVQGSEVRRMLEFWREAARAPIRLIIERFRSLTRVQGPETKNDHAKTQRRK